MFRRRNIVAKLLTVVVTLALGLLALELGFRMFGDVTDIAHYFWDPTLGPRFAPNQSGVYRSGSVRGSFRFNNQGWNHPEDYTVAKPAETFRVAIVGDSQVASLQVNPEEITASCMPQIVRSKQTRHTCST